PVEDETARVLGLQRAPESIDPRDAEGTPDGTETPADPAARQRARERAGRELSSAVGDDPGGEGAVFADRPTDEADGERRGGLSWRDCDREDLPREAVDDGADEH